MKIGIISTHSWTIPNKIHTGDYFYVLLAQTLDEMGHEVIFFAPDGSYVPPHGKQLTMPCAFGSSYPSSSECEQICFDKYKDILQTLDIVHDFSITKRIAENLLKIGYKNIISTPMGGTWLHPYPRHNIVVHSQSMRERGLRGTTDYENTLTPDLGGSVMPPITDAHVVNLGIDTEFYTPVYSKQNYFLWLGRWHPVRGYKFAIQLAKETGIKLVMAGTHPDREIVQHQKDCCFEAIKLAKNISNISFEWLPEDPHHHETKRTLLQNSKALILPTQFNEPFGLTMIESLSCGTPVITTNYGSMPEIITNNITGFTVDNNIQEFAAKLDLIKNIHPAICREQAVRKFDRKVMAKNYLKEYEKIINGENW